VKHLFFKKTLCTELATFQPLKLFTKNLVTSHKVWTLRPSSQVSILQTVKQNTSLMGLRIFKCDFKTKNGTLDCFLETKHFKSLRKKEVQVRQQTIFKRKMAVNLRHKLLLFRPMRRLLLMALV
jgi:hypothetical protein